MFEVEHPFKTPVTSFDQKRDLEILGANMFGVYELVDDLLPSGRERSIVKTKLEEAWLWSIQSIQSFRNQQETRD